MWRDHEVYAYNKYMLISSMLIESLLYVTSNWLTLVPVYVLQ